MHIFQYTHSFMAILTSNMKSCLPHGIFHVHVRHMLDEVMKELCSAVDCQPVDLQKMWLTLFLPATTELKSIRSIKMINIYDFT